VEAMNKKYDYKMLIEVYIKTQHKNHIHEDFKNYYEQLLAKLEEIFEISFSKPKLPERYQNGIHFHFLPTIDAYLSIITPRTYYLEDSLLNVSLREAGEIGQRIIAAENKAIATTNEAKAQLLEMLYIMFEAIWGKNDLVITSEELKERGFDDSKEPQIRDYYDYL
jgi:hypothetical protein